MTYDQDGGQDVDQCPYYRLECFGLLDGLWLWLLWLIGLFLVTRKEGIILLIVVELIELKLTGRPRHVAVMFTVIKQRRLLGRGRRR